MAKNQRTDLVRKALITGASEGIGRSLSILLAQEGYSLTLVARNEKRLLELVSELQGSHEILCADLFESEGHQLVSDELRKNSYTLLINNAGMGRFGTFSHVSVEDAAKLLRLNVEGLLKLSHTFLEKAKSGDALINVGSILSYLPLPGSSVYSATKAFVASFSLSLWEENRRKGVYVACLCPGSTESQFHLRSQASKKMPHYFHQSADDVARVTLKALVKRKAPLIIPGWWNYLMIGLCQWLPKRLLLMGLGQSSKA